MRSTGAENKKKEVIAAGKTRINLNCAFSGNIDNLQQVMGSCLQMFGSFDLIFEDKIQDQQHFDHKIQEQQFVTR